MLEKTETSEDRRRELMVRMDDRIRAELGWPGPAIVIVVLLSSVIACSLTRKVGGGVAAGAGEGITARENTLVAMQRRLADSAEAFGGREFPAAAAPSVEGAMAQGFGIAGVELPRFAGRYTGSPKLRGADMPPRIGPA